MTKTRKHRLPAVAQATRPGTPPTPPGLSPGRRWAFRLTAAVILPVLSLALVEFGLRLAGVGHPTSFFLRKQIKGRAVFVENDRFGLRFFPPELARSPSPVVMPAQKAEGACRIFLLGESAALGDPEPAFGVGRYLQVLLEERFPQKRFEVICTAVTAINSHAIVPIARECAQHRGDVWIIYMGNNEFVGPFGPSTIFGPQAPPLSFIRLNLALKTTRLGQLLARLVARSPKGERWGGMKMFLDHQVAPDDPRREKVYDYFRANLEDILALARRAGVKVVLSTVASNLKDCPPFGSEHAGKLAESHNADWQQRYTAGVQAQNTGDFAAALSNYQAAAQSDASFAELQFRWGQCCLAVTNLDQAKRHFELARDFDSLPFRADSRLNHEILTTAERYSGQGVTVVDGEAVVSGQSPRGIAGNELLYEHVHLNDEGNYHLAVALASAVASALPLQSDSSASQAWASSEQCALRLALTPWDRRRIYESLLHRLAEPPFVGQMDHAARIDALKRTVVNLRSQQTPQALQQARRVYLRAVEAVPDDFYVRADFAKLEEDAGNPEAAATQWQAVLEELPFAPGPHYYLGHVLARQNKPDLALKELSLALGIRPDLPEALEEKGRVLTKTKRPSEALPLLERAAELEPSNARICLDRAEALAEVGRRPEALLQLEQAVRLQPGYAEARYLLGVELALQGDIAPAAEQFLETVRLSPNYAPGHLNLGIALAKLDRLPEAMDQFEQTLSLDPKNQKAAEYLQTLRARLRNNPNAGNGP